MKPVNRSRTMRTKSRRTLPPGIERLEARELLSAAHVFAQFEGLVPSASDTAVLPITLAPTDFTLAGGRTILGFQLKAGSASSLDPAAVQIRRADNSLVTPLFSKADLSGNTQSLVLAELPAGSYNLTVRSERGSAGASQLCVFLAGDVNGDRKADLADGQILRMINGATASSSVYRVEADANLDGRIDSFDYAQWRNNNGDATRVNPLSVAVQLSPPPQMLPDGTLVTDVAQVDLLGTTNPGAAVALEADGDGQFDEGSATADGSGNFSFALTLNSGLNTLEVRASDSFGQRRTAAAQVTLQTDNAPPVIAAGLANDTAPGGGTNTDGLTSDSTIMGTVSDASRIASFRAGFDATPVPSFFDIFADLRPDGSFSLDRARLEQINGGPLVDGPHTLHLQATDEFGNVSSFFDVFFELDTQAPTANIGPSGTVDTTFSFFDVFYSEPMPGAAFAAANYVLTVDGGPRDGQTIGINSVLSVNGTTARLNLTELLANDNYRLTISPSVSDPAGNALAEPRSFSFTVNQALQIAEISPANGEEFVSLTRETIVRFTGRVDPDTVNADSFYLIANGERLPGTIRVSSTERFATFFYANPLPASTEVRVVVEGDRIIGRDGVALDADGDGNPGGTGTADFRTLPLTRIPGTSLFGFVYDSFNKNPDGSNIPIVGATIRVDAFPEANVVTDANGRFELRDMPAPEFFVHIDGSTATNAPPGTVYPSVGKPFHSVPGQTTQLNMNGVPFNIFLPPMAASDVMPLSPTQSTDVGFGPAGMAQLRTMFPDIDPTTWDRVKVTYPANSALNDAGIPATQGIIIPVPPDRIPAPLPANLNPKLVISIQAMDAQGREVTNFDVPAPLIFPNLDGLAPGEKALIFSFNHDAGRWDVIGTGTVSVNGLDIASDPGVGIRAPGWHTAQQGTMVSGTLGNPWEELEDSPFAETFRGYPELVANTI